MAYVKLIPIDRCRHDGGTFVEFDGRELAVFLLDDGRRVIALDNACPHAGGNLSGGAVDGRTVTCPWHQWVFELETGVCAHSELARVRRYPAEVREGHVWFDPASAVAPAPFPPIKGEHDVFPGACSSAVRAGDS